MAPIAPEVRGEGEPGSVVSFEGFDPPESNFWRLPNNWFDLAARFTSWAEQKVVEYILRHTWGYHEYGTVKLITMDEFMHGRKRRDGSRIDVGCGMAENSIKKGIHDAVCHGFLIVETDDSDKGRIKKYYAPRMRRPHADEGQHSAQGRALILEGQALTPSPQDLTPEVTPLTLDPRALTPSAFAADPPTEQALPARHLKQETSRNNKQKVVAHPSPFRADLLGRLIAQGVLPARARQLVAEIPAERIERQLSWIDQRTFRDRAATLVKAITEDFGEPMRKSAPAAHAGFDRGKYFRGSYALCPRCGSRPCAPDCPEPSE